MSLEFLPDISKWNLSNVNNISGLFFNCSSLISLPDISQWDLFNSNININNNELNLISFFEFEDYKKEASKLLSSFNF